MSEEQNFSTKLENTFLSILRVVILIALSITLIGTAFFAISGFSHLNPKPEQYKFEQINADELTKELKENLSPKKTDGVDKPAPIQKSKGKQVNKALDAEVDKQVAVANTFLGQFGMSLNNPQQFKNLKMSQAESLAVTKTPEGAVEYAVGETAFLTKIFTDKDLNTIVQNNRDIPGFVGNYFEFVTDYYPDFYRKQYQKKKNFDEEQSGTVMIQKAGAFGELYVAGGLFGTFLLISLILVLVKIERDLRYRNA